MSDLLELIKTLNQTIQVSNNSYVYYDEETGVIQKISSRFVIDDNFKILEVPHYQVKDILEGTKKLENFIVNYDVSLKQLALKELTYDSVLDDVTNKLHCLPVMKSYINEVNGLKNRDTFEEIYDGVDVYIWAPDILYVPGMLVWYNSNVYKMEKELQGKEFDLTAGSIFVENVSLTNLKSLVSDIEYKRVKKNVFPDIFVDIWYDELPHLSGQHVFHNGSVYRMLNDQKKNTSFDPSNAVVICSNVKLRRDSNSYLNFDKRINEGEIYLDFNKLYTSTREKTNINTDAKAVYFYTTDESVVVYDTVTKSTSGLFLEEDESGMAVGVETTDLKLKVTEVSNLRKGQQVLVGKRLYLFFPADYERDINIVQNFEKQCWEVYLGHEVKRSLELTNYRANERLYFSITSKYDPNILYRTIEFSLNDLLAKNVPNFKFENEFEFNGEEVSIYTPKYFESYLHEIIE